jgi:hypothetical protein
MSSLLLLAREGVLSSKNLTDAEKVINFLRNRKFQVEKIIMLILFVSKKV